MIKKIPIIIFIFHLSNHAQMKIKTGFVFTNQKLPTTNMDTIFYQYTFPKSYINYFFKDNDSAIVLIKPKDGLKDSTFKISREIVNQQYRSPLYGVFIPMLNSNNKHSIKPHTIYIINNNLSNFTKDKITSSDLKHIYKNYFNQKYINEHRKKVYEKTGESSGNLMGVNNYASFSFFNKGKTPTIVKRTKCSTKKKQFRKEGINGVKEMTLGM